MKVDDWLHCPSNTNALECKNRESKNPTPLTIQQAMINLTKQTNLSVLNKLLTKRKLKSHIKIGVNMLDKILKSRGILSSANCPARRSKKHPR